MLKPEAPLIRKAGGIFVNAISFDDYIEKKKRKKNPRPKKMPEEEKQFISKET